MAFVIKEYRAIPNANGIGYTREYVGHTMKDITWTVYTNPGDIVNKGIVKDSSTIETLINSYSAKTCKLKDNKIVIKVIGSSFNDMKLKENSTIDTSVIGNYSVNSSKTTFGNVDTMMITLRFDRKKNIQFYDFLYRVFYTNAIGYQVERFIPIRLYFNGSTYNLNQDTVTYCVGSTQPLKLANPIKTKVSWTPKTNIVSAEAVDSSWINVLPSASRWYYVNNLSSNQGCKINDSIYVNVDTCSTISGYMYIDKNKNCVKDTNELILGNDSLEISGISNGFTTTASTDNNGFYSFSPPPNSTYKIKVLGKSKVCNSATNELTVSVLNSNFDLHIGVKDSVKIDPPIFQFETKNLCISEINNVQLSVNKSFGNLKAIIRVGTIDSAIIDLNKSEGTYQINQNFIAKKSGIHNVNITFYNAKNQILSSHNIQTIIVNSCYVGRFYLDKDYSCTYNTGDELAVNMMLVLKDLTNNQSIDFTTDNQGQFKFNIQKNTNYEVSAFGHFSCYNDTNKISLLYLTSDTFLNQDFAFKKMDDSTNITIPVFTINSTELCIKDSTRCTLVFNKGTGRVYALLRFGNGDSITTFFDKSISYCSLNKNFQYSKSGYYKISLELYNEFGFKIYQKDLKYVTVSSCFKGNMFMDIDTNCIYSINDIVLSNYKLRVHNNTMYTDKFIFTDLNGNFSVNINPTNSYKIFLDRFVGCSNNQYYDLPQINKDSNFIENIAVQKFKFNYSPVLNYFGFPNNITENTIKITSNSYLNDTLEKIYIVRLPKNSKNITVNGAKSYVIVGKTLTIIQDLNKLIVINLKFDSVIISSSYQFQIELVPVTQFDSVYDNICTLNREGRTSYDPNNKLVAINSIHENGDFTNKNDKLHFVINFQNTGNFTAKDIFILDKLDPKLDLTTFEIGNSSHPMTVSLDDNRQVKFDFKNILLPDSFANEPASHGWVSYVIKPLQSLAENDVIKNYADIYFDYNAPVMTNQTMNKYIIKSANGNSSLISKTKDIITIYPNPASDFINIEHPKSKEYSVQLFSIDGRFIARFDSPKSIDIRSLTKGTYQVHITADKDITIQKIQVQ